MLNNPVTKGIMIELLNDTWYKQIPQSLPNFILRAMIARTGGKNPLPLHIDSFIPSSGKYCWALQISYTLDDQNLDNGCTIVVPGSLKFDEYVTTDDFLAEQFPYNPKKAT